MNPLQHTYFFDESSASESDVVRNELNANDLFLTVRGSGVNLTVYGLTDDTEDTAANWLTLRVINMSNFQMEDSITAAGQYGVPLGAVSRVKIGNSGSTVTVFGIFGNN